MMLYMCMLFVTVWMWFPTIRVGQEYIVLFAIFARCWCKFVRGRCTATTVTVNATAIRLHGIRERYFFLLIFHYIFHQKHLRAFRWHCESSYTLLKTNLFANIVQQRHSVEFTLHFANQTNAIREGMCCCICLIII